jgi:uncharacterized protein YbgA (DUF1722 family)
MRSRERINPRAHGMIQNVQKLLHPSCIFSEALVLSVVGTQDRHKLLDYIQQFREERQPINGVGNIMKNFQDHVNALIHAPMV